MIFEQTDVTWKNKVTFLAKTELYPLNVSDSSYKLSVESTVSINNESISQKETLQHTITLRGANKSKDVTVNESDVSLFQIIQSFQNENDCISVANTPPRMVMLRAGVINTSSNEARI